MQMILSSSKFRRNFAKIGNFAGAFRISPGPSKFRHFFLFGENFASLATLLSRLLATDKQHGCQLGIFSAKNRKFGLF